MKATKAKNISPLSSDKIKERIISMVDMQREVEMGDFEDYHVSISPGNRKTGTKVPNVSLIPGYGCKNCSRCLGLCYDLRNDCMYKNVQKSRATNQAIAEHDPIRYFDEISFYIKMMRAKFFRYHIGGDILDETYLGGMVRVAYENPKCTFLAFTKMYSLINGWLDKGFRLPDNLKIIFSAWPGLPMSNPYNFPTSNPLFADGTTTAHDGAKYCSGNCSECAVTKNGCFDMKPGDEVIFLAH